MDSKKHLYVWVLAGGAVLALAACDAKKTDASAPVPAPAAAAPAQKLVWAVQTEPACFLPTRNSQANAYLQLRNYVDSLVAKGPDGGYLPWLASAWAISDDGLTYTFTLRKDVSFHDGEPFNAEAVKFNFDKIVGDAAYGGSIANTRLPTYAGSSARDGNIFEIKLSKPDGALLDALSGVSLGILSPKSIEAHGADLCKGGPALAGTGPFKFESYTQGQSAVYVRNAAYNWAPSTKKHQGAAYLERVEYRFLPEAATRIGTLASGQVDAIEGVPSTDAAKFKGVAGFAFATAPANGTTFGLSVNPFKAPLDDVRVREAFHLGFDADALVQSLYEGQVQTAKSIVSPASPYYDASLAQVGKVDLDRAGQLLDAAGWATKDAEGYRVKDGKRLVLKALFPQILIRESRDVLLQSVQAAVRQNLGIQLELSIDSSPDWAKHVREGDYHFYPSSQLNSDPAQVLRTLLHSKNNFVFTPERIEPKVEQLIDATADTVDPQKRGALFKELQQYVVAQQHLFVPLYVPTFQIAAKRQVEGLDFQTLLGSPDSPYDVKIVNAAP